MSNRTPFFGGIVAGAVLALVACSASVASTVEERTEPPRLFTNEDLPPVPPEWERVADPQPAPRMRDRTPPTGVVKTTTPCCGRSPAPPPTELERARAEVYRWHKLWQDPESATRVNRINRINKVNRLSRPGRKSLDAYYLRRLHEAREELERLEGRRR